MDDFDCLLSNLKIIGHITHNGRLKRLSQGRLRMEDDNAFVPFRRFLTSESRRQTLQDLNHVMAEALMEVSKLRNDEREQEWEGRTTRLAILCRELKSAQRGLANLRGTYQTDLSIVVGLDLLMEKINMAVARAEEGAEKNRDQA
jgi:hypothetical protein